MFPGLRSSSSFVPVSYVVDKTAVNKFLHISDSSNNQETESRSNAIRQTGFVAQEVEAIVKKTGYVFYGVDVPKNENDHYSIRYAEFVVPLVKAVQELSPDSEVQQKQIEEQKQQIEQQQKQIEFAVRRLNSKNEIENKEASGAPVRFFSRIIRIHLHQKQKSK